MYAYINAVLDANPDAATLKLNASAYDVATGPVPVDEQSIPSRVAIEKLPDDSLPSLCMGYDALGNLVCQFFC